MYNTVRLAVMIGEISGRYGVGNHLKLELRRMKWLGNGCVWRKRKDESANNLFVGVAIAETNLCAGRSA